MMRLSLLPLLLSLAACGGEAAAGALATRADSAGIMVVTNHDPVWREDEGWRIDAVPTLEIGPRADADARYELLRVLAGTVLPSGQVAALSSGNQELRIYDSHGQWLRTIGGNGDGPGEFRFPNRLFRAGDTLLVLDGTLSRLSTFLSDGTMLASHGYGGRESTGQVTPILRLADGTWIGIGRLRLGPGENALPTTSGLMRHPQPYRRLAPDLATDLGVVATMMGDERMLYVQTGPGGAITSIDVTTPRLGRTTFSSADGDRFLIGDNATPELRGYSLDGTLRTMIRWEAPVRPVDEALVATLKTAELAQVDDDRRRRAIEAQFSAPLGGGEVPYFRGLWVDPTGAIWLQEFNLLPTDSLQFRIFDRDGQFLGTRSLPPRHTVLEVGREHLLTVWRDEDDLEHVRVYRLRR